jgi:hypothetical protein
MRLKHAMLVTAALSLVGAAPASAIGGGGAVEALRGKAMPISASKTRNSGKHTVCEASGSRTSKTVKALRLASKLEKQFVPVACEQPPRSLVLTADALRQATAAANNALG